jgi:serine/threonine protein kinase/tetratricopeptide (TPR) repeat protein
VTAESFARVKQVLLAVRGLPVAGRADELARQCGEDLALRQEVESLLAHDSDTDRPPVFGAAPPVTIGPYRVLEALGEGGMGVVYRAEQSSPIRREVALKLIKLGMDTRRVVARFESERQALALMDHPHIARVLDAGASESGRPYFVMELVRGRPIAEFCDEERLSVRDRLELFLAVCEAVQHAHQKGVIHRDLKPSNVLVARHDGRALPKVIDFGIAKAVSEPTGGASAFTQEGAAIGTPDYMSPEQALALAGGVDTRSDVYSLGVMLYELLTGRRPHVLSGLPMTDVHRVLGQETPPRPSTAVATAPGLRADTVAGDAPTLPDAVAARGTSRERLRRQLAGDIDNIVMKALQKERDRRYGSVEQLAEDIRRHLGHRPVQARPDTWTYRAGKFVRRHRVLVGAAAGTACLLVGFAATFAAQSRRIARERDRAVQAEQRVRQEAARARTEARTAGQVSRFLVELFEVSNPDQARGAEVTAREILDRGATRVKGELGEQPEIQGRLMNVMAEVYHSLGLYDRARPLLDDALRVNAPGRADADRATTLDLLGTVTHDTGELEASESFYRRALELRRQALGPDSPDVAQSLNNLAITLQARGDLKGAEPFYREALELNVRLLGEDDTEVAWSRNTLGWVLHAQGRLAEAEPLYRAALAVQRRKLGNVHQDVAHTLNNLAGVRYQSGDYPEATTLWREALAIYRTLYRGEHPAVARGMYNLSRVLVVTGALAEAESLNARALAMNRKLLGAEHPHVATTLSGLATVRREQRRYVEAEALARQALAMRSKLLGETHPMFAVSNGLLARILLDQGRPDRALPLARRAVELRRAQPGGAAADLAESLEDLGRVRGAQGRMAEAEALLRESLAIRRRALPAGHPDIASSLVALGTVLVGSGRAADAEALLVEGAGIRRAALAADHPQVVAAARTLESCRRALRR